MRENLNQSFLKNVKKLLQIQIDMTFTKMIKKKCGKISLSKLGISFKKCWGALYLSIFMDWNNWTIGKAIQHRVVVCQWQVLLAIVLPYTHRLLKCHKRTATQTYQDVMAHDRPKSPIGSSSDARVTRVCGRSLSIQKWNFFVDVDCWQNVNKMDAWQQSQF